MCPRNGRQAAGHCGPAWSDSLISEHSSQNSLTDQSGKHAPHDSYDSPSAPRPSVPWGPSDLLIIVCVHVCVLFTKKGLRQTGNEWTCLPMTALLKKLSVCFRRVRRSKAHFYGPSLKLGVSPAFAPVFGLCLGEGGTYPCGSASIFVSYSVHLQCAVKGITAWVKMPSCSSGLNMWNARVEISRSHLHLTKCQK